MSEDHGGHEDDGTHEPDVATADDPGPSKGRGPRRRAVVAGSALLACALVGGAVAVIAIGPARAAQRGGAASSSRACASATLKLTVSGTGTITVAPNLLTVDFDVSTTGYTVASAMNANNASSSAVVKALTAGGVAPRDVQTTNLSIQPTTTSTGTVVTGYSVDNTVVAKIRKLATAGTVVGAAVTAGGDATRVNSLTFSLTNPERAQNRVRTIAVHEAVGHAKSMASAAGERLGAICKLTDESNNPPPIVYGGMGTAHASTAPSPLVPIEPGSDTVTAHVSIVYALVASRSSGS